MQSNYWQAYVFDDGVNTEVEVTNDGLIFNNIDAGEKALVLQTRNENYVVSVDFWTAVIDDVDELKCLYNATTGKYRLNNDIDMSSIDWEYQNLYNVFTGVFDGKWRTLSKSGIITKFHFRLMNKKSIEKILWTILFS